jgi:hypothetical protein
MKPEQEQEPEPEPLFVKIRNRHLSKVAKVGTGTVKILTVPQHCRNERQKLAVWYRIIGEKEC